MSLTRTEILRGNYIYPSDLIKLKTTRHFAERLEERGVELNCIPTLVRVTKDNIYCGEADGETLTSVVVRLKYKFDRYVFLCFNPRDGFLKTLWFKDKKKYGTNEITKEDSGQAIRDVGNGDEIL